MAKIIGNKNPKKETTMDDLAVAIGNLSERMDKRFSEVDDRFDKVDDRFAGMDDRFDKVDDRFAGMDNRFDKVDDRFAGMDDRFDKQEASIDKRFNEVDDRFTEQEIKLEKIMDEKVEDLAVMVNKSFVSVTAKIDAVKLDTAANKNDLNSLRQDM